MCFDQFQMYSTQRPRSATAVSPWTWNSLIQLDWPPTPSVFFIFFLLLHNWDYRHHVVNPGFCLRMECKSLCLLGKQFTDWAISISYIVSSVEKKWTICYFQNSCLLSSIFFKKITTLLVSIIQESENASNSLTVIILF